jgi:hypothetical protein
VTSSAVQLVHESRPVAGRARRVALVSGFWGQNIGNAFFNVGGKWILEQIVPDATVNFIQDQPGYRTFHDQSRGNPANDLVLLRYVDVDYLVLQGPLFTVNFRALWEPTFRALKARRTKLILLGAAFFRYTKEEIESTRRFLAEYPPAILSTRDSDTYEALKDCAEWCHSGLDSAFFVPKAYEPFTVDMEPYVTLNFDRFPEPRFFVGRASGSTDGRDGRFSALGYAWGYSIPRVIQRFSAAGKWQAYIGSLFDRRRLPDRLGDYLVVRPEHRYNPHVTWKIYKRPAAVASDEPFTYFTVYANTSLTLSDRVHACAITLAYGKPAMLFNPSPRARLLERLGLANVRSEPVTLAPEKLEAERQAELMFLHRAVRALA